MILHKKILNGSCVEWLNYQLLLNNISLKSKIKKNNMSQKMTENFLSHEKSMEINNKSKDPFI